MKPKFLWWSKDEMEDENENEGENVDAYLNPYNSKF